MNLSDLLTNGIKGTVSFEGKFDLELQYMDKEELSKKMEACKKVVYIKHQPKEEIDVERLHKELAKCIVSWRGLTLGVVAKMIPIRVPEGLEGTEVVCDETNKLLLLKKAYGFDTFVQQASTDLSMLRREAEEKN